MLSLMYISDWITSIIIDQIISKWFWVALFHIIFHTIDWTDLWKLKPLKIMCVYVYIYIYGYIDIYHGYIYKWIYISIAPFKPFKIMYIYIYVHVYICIMYVYIWIIYIIYMDIYISMYTWISIIHIYMDIYIHYSCINKFYCDQFPLLRERESKKERGDGGIMIETQCVQRRI